ncbi:MAG: hypothetical protein D6824_00300 [Planctomycetota bacterium]|nr:MAG: hypothetical protein D6824_00300 [Planctomycetota bacterium]
MSLLAGIDEAGYGPRLGPLCAAAAALQLRPLRDSDIDLWSLLTPLVRKPGRGARGALVVGDSKKVKKPNTDGQIGGAAVEDLRRSVGAFAAAGGSAAAQDKVSALSALGVQLEKAPAWYRNPAVGEPPLIDARTAIAANQLRAAMAQHGLRPALLHCVVLDELRFNQELARRPSKAHVALGLVATLLRRTAALLQPGEQGCVHIDRQSGRKRYEPFLRVCFPEARLETAQEGATCSLYRLTLPQPRAEQPASLTVVFEVEADETRFCAALASMVAKLVRETLMRRFNEHFRQLAATPLRPTAGYARDAGRYLQDLAPHVEPALLRSIVRSA